MQQRTSPASIYVLAFDDNDELDVLAPYEILFTIGKIAKSDVPEVSIVSVPGTTADPHVVRGIHGITFGTRPLEAGEKADLLIVAGGGYGVSPPMGIMKWMCDERFTAVIRAQHDEGRQLASVCTGAFGLVGAGLVSGRTMTTHPAAVDDLAAKGARVLNPDTQARVVDDGDIISCGGVTSGIDEALYLIAEFWPQIPSLSLDVRDWVDYHFYAQVARV